MSVIPFLLAPASNASPGSPGVAYTYTVTYNGNAGMGSVPVDTTSYPSGATVTVAGQNGLSIPGYTFGGWAYSSGLGNLVVTSFSIFNNTTLVAVWNPNPTYTVTYNANTGAGSMTAQGSSIPAPLNANTFTQAGFTFSGWNTAANGSGTSYTNNATYGFNASVTLYAQWTPNTAYTITYLGNTNSSGSVPAPTIGSGVITLQTNTGSLVKPGFNFGGWNTQANGSGSSYAIGSAYTLSANITLYAKWIAVISSLATLNVTSTPAGINFITPTCYTVSSGTCGTTNWTSTNQNGIPTTTYTFPTSATIGGYPYILDANTLSGCNQGTSGLNSNECQVSVAGGAVGTIFAYYKLVPPKPFPSCAPGTNLVLNPSFESVKPDSGTNVGSNKYWKVMGQSSTEVLNWTRDASTNNSQVFNNGSVGGVQMAAFQGSRFLLLQPLGFGSNGVRGKLSVTPQVGKQYVLRVMIKSWLWPIAGTVTMRLRNSSTGLESAAIVGTPAVNLIGGQSPNKFQQSPAWIMMSGTVIPTASQNFNQVVLRYNQDGGMGMVDLVQVCKVHKVYKPSKTK